MPLGNLEFSDSDDSTLRIHIASRLLVDSKTIELLTFTPPMGYSLKGMLIIAYCIQLWISKLAKQSDSRSSFNELMDTPVDFSNFLMNRLNVDTMTPELLAGPTYELMKGSCKILVELEFLLEEIYKATTDQLD
nr:hypothetical protein [Tanacetum cinerariifolium]